MHYLEKITKIEFQSFKVKEDTKALSKIAKVVFKDSKYGHAVPCLY